ncbi:MAG: alkaline phosphatase PafA [Anditalea sp.]
MKKSMILFSLFLFSQVLYGQMSKQPKLVIGITVDQMRYDYLTRYWDKYSEDGFKKLVGEGYVMANTHYNYAPTYTGVGHATVFTGTSPAIHGIAGNNWYSKEEKRSVYCVEDNSVRTVGSSSDAGKFSPKNLKTNTVTDQLKVFSKESKVIGIALKDRGAILPVGHQADAAYWFDPENGHFVTSDYYMEELPAWVENFNKKAYVEKYLSSEWNTVNPIAEYTASTDDNVPFEGLFKGEDNPVFPHNLPELAKENGLGIIRQTPFGNTITFDLAREAITNEALGEDAITDFLSVSFSSPDYIGHQYGPHSIEVEDNYLRLDIELADFLKFLEENVGKDNYLIFLTSDHGAADVPAFVKGNTGYFNDGALENGLRKTIVENFGLDLIENITNDQVYLANDLISKNGVDILELKQLIRDELFNYEGVIGVVDPIESICLTDKSICEKIYNGHHPGRSGDISFIKAPGWIGGSNKRGGTTHGSPFPYDTHVPLIWYGAGTQPGILFREVHLRDVAPTLSLMLGIGMPNGTTGTPVTEYLEMIFKR